jgi:hypothetical protein
MASMLVRVIVVLLISIGVKLYADFTDEQIPRNDSGLPNLSDRPQTQDKSIDIFANALYWRASETVDWAHIVTSNQNSVQDSYKTISFDWDSGLRVGLGYNMLHDQWDTQIAYTWFLTRATDHGSGHIISGFLAARLSLLEPFKTGKIRFDLSYNMFDWDLGRSFLVSRSLSLRPFIGAKAGWINQTIRAEWTTPNFDGLGFLYSASENVKNNFQGGGPKGGVNGKWVLGNVNRHAFSLIGNFAGAFLWGHWTLQDEFTDVFLTQTSVPMKNRNFGALMLQALIGVGWDFNFDKNRSHFALKVSYEIQDWLNHFQVFTNDSGTDNFDLILQGLTLDLRFDF